MIDPLESDWIRKSLGYIEKATENKVYCWYKMPAVSLLKAASTLEAL